MARAFLSYARSTRAEVESLADDLVALGHETWFDRSIGVGQEWWDEILQEIRRCDVFVACVSARWLRSEASRSEWEYAQALGRTRRMVVVEPDFDAHRLPSDLAKLHFMTYDAEDKAAYQALARTLEDLPDPPELPDDLPDPPPVPLSPLSRLGAQVRQDALDPGMQDDLVRDLRRHLDVPEERDAARSWLEELRGRRDVTAHARDDIDVALEADRKRRARTPGPGQGAFRNPKEVGERFGSQTQWMVKNELGRLGALRDELERCFDCIKLSNDLEIVHLRAIEERMKEGQKARWGSAGAWRGLESALKDARRTVRDMEARLARSDDEEEAPAGDMAQVLKALIVRVRKVARGDADEDPARLSGEIAAWLDEVGADTAPDLTRECAERTRRRLRALQKAVNSLSKVLALPDVPAWEASQQATAGPGSSRPLGIAQVGGLRAKTSGRRRDATTQGSPTRF